MNFADCVRNVLASEGAYVFDSNDPGGETKFGISKRAYPDLEIKNLTEFDAIQIYRRDFWERLRCEELPPMLRYMIFDCAVNQGTGKAIRLMQECAVGISVDGKMGPATVHAVNESDPEVFLINYAKGRMSAYQSNPNWKFFGASWSRRLLEVSLISAFDR